MAFSFSLAIVKPNNYPSGFAYDGTFNSYRHWPQLKNRGVLQGGGLCHDIVDLAETVVNSPVGRFMGALALIGGAIVLGIGSGLFDGSGGEEVVVECEGGH